MIDHIVNSVFLIFGLFTMIILMDESYLNQFNSKTAYRNSILRELEDPGFDMKDCSLIHMNTILRHGTRFPSGKDVVQMEHTYAKLNKSRGRLNFTPELRAWRSSFSIIDNKQLSLVGYQEMTQLGARYRRKYNSIVGATLNKRHLKAHSTSVSRARLSGRTFLRSFLQSTFPPVDALLTDRDDILRYFDKCPSYSEKVVHNETSYVEYRRFLHGPEMKSVVKDLEKKWGIDDVSLSTDDVRILYTMCGFEIATNLTSGMKPIGCSLKEGLVQCPESHDRQSTGISPLCTLFNQDHFQIVEYLYDLKHYSIKAYGNAINWRISCKLMNPIFNQILDVIRHHKAARSKSILYSKPLHRFLSEKTYPRAIFWFAHAETILPIVTLFGLFNQTLPMTAKEFQTRISMEKDPSYRYSTFRTANIIPFSGNVGLDLYHCPRLASGKTTGYRVQIKVNEKAVAWPAAGGSSHMSIEDFLKKFKMCDPKNFNFDKECKISSSF